MLYKLPMLAGMGGLKYKGYWIKARSCFYTCRYMAENEQHGTYVICFILNVYIPDRAGPGCRKRYFCATAPDSEVLTLFLILGMVFRYW